ncbi:recombination regulator RecX [Corynebacterium dentalis]|uniref:recombination regulator RecX n=1 Tax=Corynebacterium dentalis TaxID=2014528 RepID=UPI00289ACBA0|nr:recombination regulator RecX [Corynebacterium dentalis]
MMTRNSQQQKIEALKEALQQWEAGEAPPLIDSEAEKALAPVKAKAVRLLNHRDRSAEELRGRLLDAEFDSELVDQVVQRCIENGMIDDSRFAAEWVRQRHRNQKKSPAVLRRELQRKGVQASLIEDALQDITWDDQRDIIDQLVTKKAGSIKNPPADRAEYEKCLRRIVGVPARRGFPEGACIAAARQALDQRIAEIQGD